MNGCKKDYALNALEAPDEGKLLKKKKKKKKEILSDLAQRRLTVKKREGNY